MQEKNKSFLILIFVIYLTEGINKRAHIATLSIIICLLIIGFLSKFFIEIMHLSGKSTEEVMFLVGAGLGNINFQGLLLAGVLIATLGVLDDVVLSQISAVEEIIDANQSLAAKVVYKKAMKIGATHMASMANTLFLVYAGASLVLLILFSLKMEPMLSFREIINNEKMATEIAMTLLGSIGLVLAVPLSTWLAVKFLKK